MGTWMECERGKGEGRGKTKGFTGCGKLESSAASETTKSLLL